MIQLKNTHKLQDTGCNYAPNQHPEFQAFDNLLNSGSCGSKMFSTQASKTKDNNYGQSNCLVSQYGFEQIVQPIHTLNGLNVNRQNIKNKPKNMKNLSNLKEVTKMAINQEQRRGFHDIKMDNRTNREEQKKKAEIKKKITALSQQQLIESLNNQKNRKITKNLNRDRTEQNFMIQKQINKSCFSQVKGIGFMRNKIEGAYLLIKNNTKAINQFQNSLKSSLKNSRASKNYEIVQQESSSIQYINDETPGPGKYFKTQKVLPKQMHNGTFGNSQRFQISRPITAKAQFIDPGLQKPKKDNKCDDIAFGTNKKNLRSQIRRIEFCDWNRPHFYEIDEIVKNKSQKQDPCFQSNIERFIYPEPKYRGPDFYQKDGKRLSKSNEKPSFYFLSQVQKGLKDYKEKSFEDLNRNSKNTGKSNEKKSYFTNFRPKKSMIGQLVEQNIKDKKDQMKNSVEIQTRKNSIVGKKRKPHFSDPKRSTKSFKQYEENRDEEGEKESKTQSIQEIKLLQAHLKKRFKSQKNNNWIKASYNVHFQSKTTLI